jgi:hypothetical protein
MDSELTVESNIITTKIKLPQIPQIMRQKYNENSAFNMKLVLKQFAS